MRFYISPARYSLLLVPTIFVRVNGLCVCAVCVQCVCVCVFVCCLMVWDELTSTNSYSLLPGLMGAHNEESNAFLRGLGGL